MRAKLLEALARVRSVVGFASLLTRGMPYGSGFLAHSRKTLRPERFTSNSKDVALLWARLLDDLEVPLRCEKLMILASGLHEGASVWNGGRPTLSGSEAARVKDTIVASAVAPAAAAAEAELVAFLEERATKTTREYSRSEKLNRHGHGRSRPSFWMLGFSSLLEMETTVSEEAFEGYLKEHTSCTCTRPYSRSLGDWHKSQTLCK